MRKRMTKKERDRARFERYINRTIGNKVVAVLLTWIAGVTTYLTNDATFLVFTLFLTVPMFFAWEQWIY